jgi:hypothetical protein
MAAGWANGRRPRQRPRRPHPRRGRPLSPALPLAGLAAACLAACAPPALAAAPVATSPRPSHETVAAEDAFARLSRLAGVWRPADKPDSPLRIRFYLTAGGTVLVESWEARGKPHSLTLYHRDDAALLATHYCPQGNQPRLALAGRDRDGLHFTFRDATDLDRATESHQHDLWFDLTDPERPVRGETYSGKAGRGAQERLALVRDAGAR